MPSAASIADADAVKRNRRNSILLVFVCTLIGAPAQMLMKQGAALLPKHMSMMASFWAMATDVPLIAGLSLYGISFALLTLALRHGQLSIVYPVIALTYVWVAILSVIFFHESMNVFKFAGISAVVAGVAILGWAGKS